MNSQDVIPYGKYMYIKFSDPSTRPFPSLSYEYITRLCYLATNIDVYGHLVAGGERYHKSMSVSDMRNDLGLSGRNCYDFIHKVMEPVPELDGEPYIIQNGNEYYVNKKVFSKSYPREEDILAFRVDCGHFRRMYDSCTMAKHRGIGTVIAMLPMVNENYNVICKNPWEENISKIQMARKADVCRFLGTAMNQGKRLTEKMKVDMLAVEGCPDGDTFQGRLCKEVTSGTFTSVVINPSVFVGKDSSEWFVEGFLRVCEEGFQ